MDIKADRPRGLVSILGSGTIKDVRSNRFYANFGAGVIDDVDVFLRFGTGDARPDANPVPSNIGDLIGDNDYDFIIGIGGKATFWTNQDGTLKLGGLMQMSWTRLIFEDPIIIPGSLPAPFSAFSGLTVAQDTDISLFEVQLAVGPTYSPIEGLSLYGGPFLHFIDGYVNTKVTHSVLGVARTSSNLEQRSILGGYLGGEYDITEELSVRAEYMFTAGGWAVATGVSWAF